MATTPSQLKLHGHFTPDNGDTLIPLILNIRMGSDRAECRLPPELLPPAQEEDEGDELELIA